MNNEIKVMDNDELIKETMMLDYSQLVMHNVYMIKENKRLHSIIKEVREYIKEHQCCDGKINVMTKTEFERLLEILDSDERRVNNV